MPDLLTEREVEFLLPMVDEAIACQGKRVALEHLELARLEKLKDEIRRGRLPGKVEKVGSGMVTLEMREMIRRKG